VNDRDEILNVYLHTIEVEDGKKEEVMEKRCIVSRLDISKK